MGFRNLRPIQFLREFKISSGSMRRERGTQSLCSQNSTLLLSGILSSKMSISSLSEHGGAGPITPVLRQLRQEDRLFKASLSCVVRELFSIDIQGGKCGSNMLMSKSVLTRTNSMMTSQSRKMLGELELYSHSRGMLVCPFILASLSFLCGHTSKFRKVPGKI